MKKFIALILPILILSPFLIFLNALMSFGLDLTYPDFYGYYPFPITICNPECGRITFGIFGSVVYWIIAFVIYIKKLHKYNYGLGRALGYCLILASLTFLTVFISVMALTLF